MFFLTFEDKRFEFCRNVHSQLCWLPHVQNILERTTENFVYDTLSNVDSALQGAPPVQFKHELLTFSRGSTYRDTQLIPVLITNTSSSRSLGVDLDTLVKNIDLRLMFSIKNAEFTSHNFDSTVVILRNSYGKKMDHAKHLLCCTGRTSF